MKKCTVSLEAVPKTKIDVSIIIISYNTKLLLRECLSSIYHHTKDLCFEVIVFDNASNDGSPEMVREEFPYVTLIQNDENLGFAKANNLGFELAHGKYLFLLNPDTVLINNAIKIFFIFMETNAKGMFGVVGAVLLDKDHKLTHSHGEFLTLFGELLPRYRKAARKLITCKSTGFFSKSELVLSENEVYREVDYIAGADLFLPKKLIELTGGFDTDYFMYSEEMDLQYRLKWHGYKRVLIPGPKIVHYEGASFLVSNTRRIMMTVSKLIYVKKHYCLISYIFFKIFLLFSIVLEGLTDWRCREYRLDEHMQFFKKCLGEEYR